MATTQPVSNGASRWQFALPPLWLIFVYLAVAIVEGHDISPPPGTLAWLIFESRHAAAHALAFGLEIWLIARAFALPPESPRRVVWLLIGLGVALGIGLEALQWARRPEYEWLGGLWDIIVDSLGALAGWRTYCARWQATPGLQKNTADADFKA